jgi:hypothetical protein
MKNILRNISFPLFFATLLCLTNISFGQKDFTKLVTSTDSTYGYSAQNPLKLKKGNQGKSIVNSEQFLSGLKTKDNQTLIYLFRATVSAPTYKEPKIRLNNRYTGMPISGKLGLLDKYVFLTSNSKDTVRLFVDIYNKGTLMVPVGLKYVKKHN